MRGVHIYPNRKGMMKKYFITSDVHSFYDELCVALDKNGFDTNNNNHILVLCGDLFDRGPKSEETLDFVKSLGDRFIFVRGNHEDLLSRCVYDIVSGRTIGSHHYSNGTVKTISQLCGVDEREFNFIRRSDSINSLVYEKMLPIMDWIDNKAINYYELNDHIFVHGWVPISYKGLGKFGDYRNLSAAPRNQWNDCLWEEARWLNPFDMYRRGAIIPNKTIVCGHWHTSWWRSHIKQTMKEFPQKNQDGWEGAFYPVFEDGICALDSCCAYSGFLNCVILEV